ncbi:cytochrome o ubiquinol oxidase subunit II, partial [Pseudomonas syringae pv. tagetis]
MLLLSGCDGVPLLDPKGQVCIEQRNLIEIATLLMLIVVIPLNLMNLILAWKYRPSNKAAKYTTDWSHSTK